MRGREARWGIDNVALCLPACQYLTGPVRRLNQQVEVLITPGSGSVVIQDASAGFRASGDIHAKAIPENIQ